MFPGDSETELESGSLRSGRRFRSRKRRSTVTIRGSHGMTGVEDYDLALHFDKGSCDEEEEYQPIPKKEEEEETPYPEYEYTTHTTPRTSLELRSRNSYPNYFVNQGNNSCGDNKQGIPTCQEVPRMNIMPGNDIKFPIFNGNGLEDLEQHWFLCEAVWICDRSKMKT